MEDKPELTDIKIIQNNIFGDVCLRKQRRKRHKFLIIELLHDFAKNSTLHGLRNIIDKKLSIIERIFWLVTFLTSVGICFYLMSNVWVKWHTSPVIVSVSEHLVPVGKVPFPSVTICPQTKCNWRIYNYTEEYQRLFYFQGRLVIRSPDDEIAATKCEDVSLVCKDSTFGGLNRTGNASIVSNILEVALDNSMYQCNWRDHSLPCEDIFKLVLTREGPCYNMNSLAVNEMFHVDKIQHDYNYSWAEKPSRGWSLEEGYNNVDPDPYPRRGRENAGSVDLAIWFQEYVSDADQLCNNLESGYRIYLQHPADLPQSTLYYYSNLPGKTTSLAVNINILNTSRNLISYPPETRQCYFPNERQLDYFQIYTASNCRIECLSKFVYKQCQCVWFHMPHINSSQLCTSKDKYCVEEAEESLAEEELKLIKGIENDACNCLPPCDSVEYDAEVLKTAHNAKKAFEVQFKLNLTGNTFSKIELYFKKPQYVSMRRSELFGVTDFLANCGGLLGLFLGFSFLSLVEIFYYLTLRIGCILKKDIENEKLTKGH